MVSERQRDKDFESILERIREARNFDFRHYKRATLRRRIAHRMAERSCNSAADYLELLGQEPAEFDALISAMLIKVTSFFRDPEAWEALRTKVIPKVIESRVTPEIRVWCAGCATGEEVFSVAILLAEALGNRFKNQEIKVFGTDGDEQAISYARRGLYTRQQVEDVPKELLTRWFVEDAAGYTLRMELRRSAVFGVNNMVSDAPISRLDLLLCRNVFIYLDAALQKRVLSRFHYALRRNGYLMLGKSELIPFVTHMFEPVDLSRRIYCKDSHHQGSEAQERLLELLEEQDLKQAMTETGSEMRALDHFHREVLQSLPLPVLCTSLDGSVTFWNGAAARLWGRMDTDVVGKRLVTLNLPGLSGELLIEKTNLVRGRKSDSERCDTVIDRDQGTPPMALSVEVSTYSDTSDEITGLVYVVHDITRAEDAEAELHRLQAERQAAREAHLTINEELQSSNEELETTNEELQSANEELQTTNEELQSTNEELETTNEELQSTNAELDAINRELEHRTEQMNLLGFYQRTIIRSLSAAVIVLDPKGRITMWNLAAERLLGLTEVEAVGQALWTLRVPALSSAVIKRIRKSLSQGASLRTDEISYALPAGGHGRGTLAAMPLVDGHTNLGSVIVFEDNTRVINLASENARLKRERRERGDRR